MRFARLGQFLVARRRWVLVVGLVAMVAAGLFGADVASKLSNGGFEDPSSDGAKATAILNEHFGAGEPNVILLVRADGTSVDDPAVAAAGEDVTARLAAADGVSDVVSYWSLGSPPPLRADDSSSALVLGRINGSEDEIRDRVDTIRDELTFDDGTIKVGVSGREAVFAEMGETIEKDLALAEMIAFPITLILLIFVFRSVIAAILPLAVGGLAIVGTFFVLEVLAGLTTVSIFALNLTTAMGLGLAIDYSLFVISRYREEREAGYASNDAVIRAGGDRWSCGVLQRAHRRGVALGAARLPHRLPALVRLRRRTCRGSRGRSVPSCCCRPAWRFSGTASTSSRYPIASASISWSRARSGGDSPPPSCAGRFPSRPDPSPCCWCSAFHSCASRSASPTIAC